MPNDPLGISFSPFGPQDQRSGQGGQSGPPASTPQSAIQMLNFRAPRTVGASAPVGSATLLNGPGGAVFGQSGQNLEQLLTLLFGRMRGGVGALPAGPQAFEGSDVTGGNPPPLPWEVTGPGRAPGPAFVFGRPPDEGGARIPPPPAYGGPNQPTGPPSAGPLPWEGPANETPSREGRLI
jgi:hypothetical protein